MPKTLLGRRFCHSQFIKNLFRHQSQDPEPYVLIVQMSQFTLTENSSDVCEVVPVPCRSYFTACEMLKRKLSYKRKGSNKKPAKAPKPTTVPEEGSTTSRESASVLLSECLRKYSPFTSRERPLSTLTETNSNCEGNSPGLSPSSSATSDSPSQSINSFGSDEVLFMPLKPQLTVARRRNSLRETLTRTIHVSYTFAIPCIILTLPDDEDSYYTQSPFPVGLFAITESRIDQLQDQLTVPILPNNNTPRSRYQWPHPAGPWLRPSSTTDISSPEKGSRLGNGRIVGWSDVSFWRACNDSLSSSTPQYILFPPPRLARQSDYDRREERAKGTTKTSTSNPHQITRKDLLVV
ncbi:uncharacterized protein MELLADRAFT_108054 [Melampsora larici-populina 98AG31]|uniref:Uncharacterized protein n=1 Tax=Melampsora larici-populina (strain 98AG31 / pathotype 3-4-7) TaxID=747676 RepID=F4RRT6_MELLP|nr:uncharacterized protein MELLADRAFT_108054 [Melampsora larici-populina 98AG31]EGG04897.1 hypothetical protein MELLADRAFT_108054 [Melampsora larici-populina 98AG31]